MSILSCNRRGCDTVMCTRYSFKYGYICYSCFERLVSNGRNTNIEEFMATSAYTDDREDGAYERFNDEFELQIT